MRDSLKVIMRQNIKISQSFQFLGKPLSYFTIVEDIDLRYFKVCKTYHTFPTLSEVIQMVPLLPPQITSTGSFASNSVSEKWK